MKSETKNLNKSNPDKKRASSLIVSACLLVAAAGVVGDGAMRWVLLSIAVLVGLIVAIKSA